MSQTRFRRVGLALLLSATVLIVGQRGPGISTAHAQFGQLQVNPGGPYSGQAGQAIFFAAQALQNGTTPTALVTYNWNFGDGTTGIGQSTTKTYATSGTFTVTVVATTATGLTGFATTTASIGGTGTGGTLVVSAGGPYSGQPNAVITMSAQATLNGSVPASGLTYQWNFGDGTSGTGQFVNKVYTSAGNFNVSVTVVAATGQTGTATTLAQIGTGQTGSLTISAGGPYTAQVGVPITMTAQINAATFQPGLTPTFFWNFGDGTTGTGQTVTKTYSISGNFTVTVTANTATGQSASASTNAQVGNQGGLFVSAGGPYSAVAGQPITLSGTVGNLPTGITVNYLWDFGDGTTGSGQTVTKTYPVSGSFTVTLTISTSTGQSGSGTSSVTVTGTASTTTTGATEPVQLFPVCNNVALTWQAGTAITVVVQSVQPSSGIVAIWRFNNTTQTFSGYSTTPGAPNDLQTVAARAEPVYICMNTTGTLTRPII